MARRSRAPRVTAHAERILARVGLQDNPYLLALEEGHMSLEGFRESQEQFYFAVTFFSRPMAALVARIPDPRARAAILGNILEEHGNLEDAACHEATFRRFLDSLGSALGRRGRPRGGRIGGVGVSDLAGIFLWPELRAFNSVLTSACILDEVEVGLGCLGIIEQAFAGISARIGQAVVANGWVKRGGLVHYKVHARIDERHAEEFFALLEPCWGRRERRYYADQGLELGAYAFDRLYRDMHRRLMGGV